MDITNEQLKKLFELASMEDKLQKNEITSADISEAIVEIERKIYSFTGAKSEVIAAKKILIADDLELSIYQLTTVLKKIGLTPSVARHKEEAISELQKLRFDCVILDLFIPDSSDGLDLIKLAVEKKKENNNNCKIVAISGTDDVSLVNECYSAGVDFYISKDETWHSKLLKYLGTTFQSSETTAGFTNYIVNGNVIVYDIKQFGNQRIFDELTKNITSSIYTGLKYIILDLKEISTFEEDNAYIFAELYKLCNENSGKLAIINPSVQVKQALEFAFLDDVIPCYSGIDSAICEITKEKI